jgi:hypothetical protein
MRSRSEARGRRALAALLLLAGAAQGAEAPSAAPPDPRETVSMPALQQSLLRREMVGHMSAVHRLIQLLGSGELAQAAEIAEKQLGFGAMGQHAAATGGMGPGRFMPDPMRAIGIGMHEAATRFAERARAGDAAGAHAALASVTGACVACHSSYRLQ